MPGEFDFIVWIRAQQQSSDLVQVPAGDDLAVLKWPANDLVIVGADQVLDGVHFDSASHSPRAIGRKAMNRNLSDCAAMACLPTAAIVTVALPRAADLEFAKELYLGMQEAGDRFDCPIVGGDTGSWDEKLAVSVAILGRSGGVTPVTRAGARPGDGVFVTGPLGGSLLRRRHMVFEPRVRLGRALGERKLATAMIDLSDGLSRDLAQICRASNVGAVIYGFAVPVHDDVLAARGRDDGGSPLEHALHDGEDYELLFTSPRVPSELQTLSNDITGIGEIIEQPGLWLQHEGQRVRLEPQGWEHEF